MAPTIRVAALSMAHEYRKPASREDNLRHVAESVADIAYLRPDLVALPEIYPTAGLSGDEQSAAHDTEQIQDLARRYRTHVVGSLNLNRDGRRYNTAVFVDRDGEIVGRYDKVHPTEGEMANGISPGTHGQPPVRTELGTLGALICFDANWPRDWEALAARGASLVVFPSAFPGGRLLEALALQNSICVVPATWGLFSGIIDNTGRWLARTDRYAHWVWADVNLGRAVFHLDFQWERIRDIRRKYGPRIRAETFHQEALFTLEPLDGDLAMDDVIAEFGLVTYRDYIARATAAQDVARPSGERA